MTVLVFSGKGGTGKTTLSALSTRCFVERGEITLALDLDPDAHLHKLLGVRLRATLGQMVDRIHQEKKAEMEPKKPVDVSDQEYLLSLIAQEVVVEEEKFDLLTLGKPSLDIDCYCPVYLWSEYAISQLMKSYRTTYGNVVVDCDPGTEIFPRKILDQVAASCGIDCIVAVLDGSKMSLDTAREIKEQVEKRRMNVRKTISVCNRVDDTDMQEKIREVARTTYGLEVAGFIPCDLEIVRGELANRSILHLPESPAYKAAKALMTILEYPSQR
jgi:CO dehydrogenase nickel-insertion accessory protein CooC1